MPLLLVVWTIVTCCSPGYQSIYHNHQASVDSNCATHLVAQQPGATHVTSILKALHWLAVEQRIAFKVITDLQDNNLEPCYESPFSPLQSTNLENNCYCNNLLEVHLKTYGDRAFSFVSPEL